MDYSDASNLQTREPRTIGRIGAHNYASLNPDDLIKCVRWALADLLHLFAPDPWPPPPSERRPTGSSRRRTSGVLSKRL